MWNEVVEWFPHDHAPNSEQETKAEIKNLFRNWMIFIIIIDLFLIAMGIVAFSEMQGVCPEYQRWTLCFAVSFLRRGIHGTQYAITRGRFDAE